MCFINTIYDKKKKEETSFVTIISVPIKIVVVLKYETYYFYTILYFKNTSLLKIWKIQLLETLKNFFPG